MATVNLNNDNIKVKVPAGMSLRQVAQKTGASMEFGCRVGDCATCVASIEEGMEYLNPLTPKEEHALKVINALNNKTRLMCQCRVESDEGEINISYINA